MGLFDRFGRGDASPGRTYEAQRTELSEDEQALARYRYMLKTAPPEALEQAHAEAFARLTPQQRRMLLEQLRAEMPVAERAYAADDPQSLARLATRAEVRQPGALERVFNRVPGAPGIGGMMAGSFLGSMAGAVVGTMIAESFLGNFAHAQEGSGFADHAREGGHDTDRLHDGDAGDSDSGGGFDDFGDFDPGSIDV